eukprot:897823_1
MGTKMCNQFVISIKAAVTVWKLMLFKICSIIHLSGALCAMAEPENIKSLSIAKDGDYGNCYFLVHTWIRDSLVKSLKRQIDAPVFLDTYSLPLLLYQIPLLSIFYYLKEMQLDLLFSAKAMIIDNNS